MLFRPWPLGALLVAILAVPTRAGDVPEAFAPFEYLVGGWKGTAIPAANKLKGWPERHVWGWKFDQGKPVALTLKFDGDKLISAGVLAYDPAAKTYRLDAKDADDKAVRYTGKLDESGRALVLKADAKVPGDPQISIRLNDNGVRYTVWVDRKEPGATRPRREIEIGLTKDGEALGAVGGPGGGGPKCIVTGGAATMTVTYQGKSYPLCCTGCRDEFNESPEKYVAKAAKLGQGTTPEAGKAETTPTKPAAPVETKKDTTPSGKSSAPNNSAKAASLLRLGQALEKTGKKAGALDYYQRILKEAPDTPEAKVAAERIKALEGK